MKKLLTTVMLLASWGAVAQGTAGLVAHWDMNGSVNDVTGNGHDGHMHGIVPAAGMDGIPNTAYYFDGDSSVITAPYMPDLNVTQFSICSKLKVIGFNHGYCQGNYVIARGTESFSAGNWSLRFDDNAYNTCAVLDTTKEVFHSTAGTNAPPSGSYWQYSPQIVADTWYNVVVTFNGTSWKVYVDCNLVNTVPGSGVSMSPTTDSVAIGREIHNPAAPFPFHGIIDDIRFYNRVIADTEIAQYCLCGSITAQPSDAVVYAGADTTFTVNTTMVAPSWQWQADTGVTGYHNISDGGHYSGTTTGTLTVTGATNSMSGNNYRCVLYTATGCHDTTTAGLLTVSPLGAYNPFTADANVLIYPNPSGDYFSVSGIPDGKNVQLQLIDAVGRTVLTKGYTVGMGPVNIAVMPVGVYTLKIDMGDRVLFRQLIKNKSMR